MSEPMALDRALVLTEERLPSLERVLSPELVLALRTVFDAASGSHLAKLVAETNRTTAIALAAAGPAFPEPPPEANTLTTPHLFLGGSGKPCCLCDRPRDHDIHPNRSAP